MDTFVLNIMGAPCAGKTALAHGIMFLLKSSNIHCEHVPEYAKGKMYEESHKTLDVQDYVFGKQLLHTTRCNNKVEVIVTDAPLLHSIIYDSNNDPEFKALVLKRHSQFSTLNIFLNRAHPYDSTGRYQSEEDADKIGENVKQLLRDLNIDFIELNSGLKTPWTLLKIIKERLNQPDRIYLYAGEFGLFM